MKTKLEKHQILTILVTAAMLGLIAIMIISLFPLVREAAANTKNETVLINYIHSHGLTGVPVLIGMQALQIVVAVIPAAAIQLLTGLCYGVWWGTLINIVGTVLGNLLVFTALRQLEGLLAPFFKKKDEHEGFISVKKLSHMKHPERVAFFFFLIPGIPNGVIPYVFAQTKLPLKKYMLAVAVGSIPSTFLIAFLGDRVSKGNYTTAIVIGVVVVVILAVVLIFKKKIMGRITAGAREEQKKTA